MSWDNNYRVYMKRFHDFTLPTSDNVTCKFLGTRISVGYFKLSQYTTFALF